MCYFSRSSEHRDGRLQPSAARRYSFLPVLVVRQSAFTSRRDAAQPNDPVVGTKGKCKIILEFYKISAGSICRCIFFTGIIKSSCLSEDQVVHQQQPTLPHQPLAGRDSFWLEGSDYSLLCETSKLSLLSFIDYALCFSFLLQSFLL